LASKEAGAVEANFKKQETACLEGLNLADEDFGIDMLF